MDSLMFDGWLKCLMVLGCLKWWICWLLDWWSAWTDLCWQTSSKYPLGNWHRPYQKRIPIANWSSNPYLGGSILVSRSVSSYSLLFLVTMQWPCSMQWPSYSHLSFQECILILVVTAYLLFEHATYAYRDVTAALWQQLLATSPTRRYQSSTAMQRLISDSLIPWTDLPRWLWG